MQPLKNPCKRSRQQGFLIPLAIFILLALATLAVVAQRFAAAGVNFTVQEAISLQSQYAAQSGLAYAKHQLLSNQSVALGGRQQCAAINNHHLQFRGDGLNRCVATLRCQPLNHNASEYLVVAVTSEGQCGVDDLKGRRLVQQNLKVAN